MNRNAPLFIMILFVFLFLYKDRVKDIIEEYFHLQVVSLVKLFKNQLKSPINGRLANVSEITGQAILSEPPLSVEVDAFMSGKITKTLDEEGVVIETEGVMIQMIHTIGENGFAVDERSFLRDIGFIIEAVRSTLYREMGIAHPMSDIISAITKVRDSNNTSSQFHFSIDDDKLRMITEKLNEEETTDPEIP